MSVFIIAEIGINHNGDIGIAKELIDISVDAGADARDVASSFNIISGTTGVIASAVTRGRLSFNAAATFTFTLQGKSSSASTVTATITATSDLTSIKDAINGFGDSFFSNYCNF